jgi:hypothetical protein
MIIEGKLLLPMRGIIGVVYIEDNGWGRLRVTRNKVVNQGPRETIEVFAVYLVFQTGEGGCTGSVLFVVQGRPLNTEFEPGVPAETIGVVPVHIPRSNLIDALGQPVTQRVVNIGLMPLIMDSCCKALREPNLAVDPSQEECAEVRRPGPTLEIRTDGLSDDRRKTQLFWARIGHKQTLCRFYGMDWTRSLFYQRLIRGLSVFMKNAG